LVISVTPPIMRIAHDTPKAALAHMHVEETKAVDTNIHNYWMVRYVKLILIESMPMA